jgi:hypothetical protein
LIGYRSRNWTTPVHGDGEGSGYAGQVAGIPSLCIPALNLEDGPQGVGDATKPE